MKDSKKGFALFRRECERIAGKYSKFIEEPPVKVGADLALPCFRFSKKPDENAKKLAEDFGKKIKGTMIERIEASGPYVNFHIDAGRFSEIVIRDVLRSGKKYGSSILGRGKKIVIDFSSPNIGKPMNIGHLRSTIIGQSLYNIYKFLGYKCIGDNHLGDWGTQFGKLIYAYKKWGSASRLKKKPIKELLALYVKFHEEAKKNNDIEDEGRKWFRKLEKGNKEAGRIWKMFHKLSMNEFNKMYKLLGVKFDKTLGESFYEKMLAGVLKDALRKKAAVEENGALIIKCGELPPLLIRKSDGATLYSTRELACMKYRKQKLKADKLVYVAGSEQKLYFEQCFIAAEKLGYIKKRDECVHVDFGLISLPEGKLSTRQGRVIFLEDVINRTMKLAEKIIEKKNPGLKNKKETAKKVAIGAIKYNDLSRDRIKNIMFDWKQMLQFEGDTGPYLQYTYTRACSVLRKSKKRIKASMLDTKQEFYIAKKLSRFGEVIEKAAKEYKPNYIANYLFELATLFNEFYQKTRIIGTKDEKEKLALTKAVTVVLENGLRLLGIETMRKM